MRKGEEGGGREQVVVATACGGWRSRGVHSVLAVVPQYSFCP